MGNNLLNYFIKQTLSLKFKLVTADKVLKLLTELNPQKATGLDGFPAKFLNPIRSGGGALKAPPLRFFALTHLILELYYCALVTFPKK